MGILDFIRRKKKEEEFGDNFDNTSSSNEDYHEETLGPHPFHDQTLEEPSDLKPRIFEDIQQLGGKDIQLLLAKVELINQRLEVIDRRLQVIEKIAKESQ